MAFKTSSQAQVKFDCDNLRVDSSVVIWNVWRVELHEEDIVSHYFTS